MDTITTEPKMDEVTDMDMDTAMATAKENRPSEKL
jgi:hypothetical protein